MPILKSVEKQKKKVQIATCGGRFCCFGTLSASLNGRKRRLSVSPNVNKSLFNIQDLNFLILCSLVIPVCYKKKENEDSEMNEFIFYLQYFCESEDKARISCCWTEDAMDQAGRDSDAAAVEGERRGAAGRPAPDPWLVSLLVSSAHHMKMQFPSAPVYGHGFGPPSIVTPGGCAVVLDLSAAASRAIDPAAPFARQTTTPFAPGPSLSNIFSVKRLVLCFRHHLSRLFFSILFFQPFQTSKAFENLNRPTFPVINAHPTRYE